MNGGRTVTDKYLNHPDVRLRYIEKGSGAPVILVHGYMVDLEFQWTESGVFQDLAKDFHVFAYDNRGHGKSQKFYNDKSYGIELANDLFRFMDGVGLEKAHVVGYSMGAMIVARCLAERQSRFLSATLGGGAGRYVLTDEEIARNESDAQAIRRRDVTAHIIRLWPEGSPLPVGDALRTLNEEALAGKDIEAIACVRTSTADLVVPLDELAKVTEPLLGLIGTADPFLPNLSLLKKARPETTLVKIPGASHADAPATEEFKHTLRHFLLSASGGRAEDQTDNSPGRSPAMRVSGVTR